MNKATVAKLEKLNKLFHGHEEAIEQKFTAKQVAILKYRIGAEDNTLHELTEVAEHFKCSVSYVTKVIRDITAYAQSLKKASKKEPVKKKVVAKKLKVKSEDTDRVEGAKVMVMTAKIENGRVTVNHPDPVLAAKVQEDLQNMIDDKDTEAKPCGMCPMCINDKKMKIGQEALKLQNKALGRMIFSVFLAAIAAAASIYVVANTGETSTEHSFVGFLLSLGLVGTAALIYISGLALYSKRDGMLEAVRKM